MVLRRATRDADGGSVLLRISEPEATSRLRHEYDLLARLSLAGVLRPLQFELYRGRAAAVFENFAGRNLSSLFRDQHATVSESLSIVLEIAVTLGYLHARGVIHNQLKTSNILYCPESGQIRLIGFELADEVNRATEHNQGRDIEGAPAYISPERTGQLSTVVDFRSDLYSLGIIFYRLLTGRLPFDAPTPVDLLYAQIAQIPAAPIAIRPELPSMASAIVMKLLEKDPGRRYQSAFGLKRDLETCIARISTADQNAMFDLGAHDFAQDLRFPAQLFGRDPELAAIDAALQACAEGRGQLVLISGSAGSGKSMLARHGGRAIRKCSGYFAEGKFDQLRRDIPYSAVLECFNDLIRQILLEPGDRVEKWRARLRESLGANGQVALQILPQLRLVLGKQPAAAALGPAETVARFNFVIAQFVRALAAKEHPLVLFFDDLQWSDTASLNVLRSLVADGELAHLTIIAAYRASPQDCLGPLEILGPELESGSRTVRRIRLDDLTEEPLKELITATLRAPPSNVQQLAQAAIGKTYGNPFYTREFLTSLYNRGMLAFDPAAGCWTWDIDSIRALDATENVVSLVSARLSRLPVLTQQALQVAAAIGVSFSVETLSTVCERIAADLIADLAPAVAAELIIPGHRSGPNRDHMGGDESAVKDERRFRFVHDSVQQAAYAQIPPSERPALHQRIACLLLRAGSETDIENRVYELLNHLNVAGVLSERDGGRHGFMSLNLSGARKAKSSAAYETAARYLEKALQVASGDDWSSNFALMFDLHLEAAETAYLRGDYAWLNQIANVALPRARTAVERASIYEILIRYYNSSMQFELAVDTGLVAAGILGERLPKAPSKLSVALGLVQIQLVLRAKGMQGLRALPEMRDPMRLAALRVLMLTASAAYFARPNLFALLVFRMVRLSVRYGAASLSAFAYVCYGLLLCAIRGDMAGGYRYGELALEMLERFDAKHLRAKVVFLFHVFVSHWTTDMGTASSAFLQAAATGLETGDLEFMSYNIYMHCTLKLIDGEPLNEIRRDLRERYTIVAKYKQDKVELLLRMVCAVVSLLRVGSAAENDLPGPFDKDAARDIWEKRHDHSALAYWHCFEAFLAYGNDDYVESAKHAREAHRHYGSLMGQPFVPFLLYIEALTCIEQLPMLSKQERRLALRTVVKNRNSLTAWAKQSPMNYLRKARVLEAECAALRRRNDIALRLYDEAVTTAARDGSVLDEALAAERAAKFCLDRGMVTTARAYSSRSSAAFARWGAPSFRAQPLTRIQRRLGKDGVPVEGAVPGGAETLVRFEAGEVDFEAVLRATRTLSQQVVVTDVLRELVRIAMATAGATHGLLVLVREGSFVAEAEGETGDKVRILHSIPIDQRTRVARSVLAHCYKTGESILLNEGAAAGAFSDDSYLQSNDVRSLLSVPLLNRGQVIGMLYLENTLTTNAFAPARLEILRVFAAQAAIAIRNAELYGNLERSLSEQMELASAHARFVPHQFIAALGKRNITEIKLGDRVLKKLSAMFVDMRAYSTTSERMSPTTDMEFVNVFCGQVDAAVLANRGVVESYHGDGVLALFEEPADDAVRGGIAVLNAIVSSNEMRERYGTAGVKLGIGINTGDVMLGIVGGASSMKCSVIGDAVNLGKRIEGLTKVFDCPLLIGEDTYHSLRDPGQFLIRQVGRVRVKGRARAVTIYEVFDADPPIRRDAKAAAAERFQTGCERYYGRDFVAAAKAFEECVSMCPGDRAAASFLSRSRANAVSVPEDWDGIEQVLDD
jgi:predicted ATPase/class 3 adenylate cyclase